jgi:bla regulator protein blaR1
VSIFTAVQEQLGLKLESAAAPLDVLIVEHAERPTPN